jgi:hypothetical protein
MLHILYVEYCNLFDQDAFKKILSYNFIYTNRMFLR